MVEIKQEKNGYTGTLWQRPAENCPFDIIRIELNVKDLTKEQWFAALKEGPPTERAKVKKVVKEYGPQDRVIYIRMGFPISLISDREQVIRWTRDEINETDSTLLLRSVLIDECPITDKVVRA